MTGIIRYAAPVNTLFIFLAVLLTAVQGCIVSDDVTIRKIKPHERFEYSSSMINVPRGLMPLSVNVLGNFLLHDLYRNEPERLLEKLEKLYHNENRGQFVEVLADCSLNLGMRFAGDPDRAARFYLSAVIYSYGYITRLDKPEAAYNPSRMEMIRIYNLALTELFACLSEKNLERSGGFELTSASGQTVFFDIPEYRMPVKKELLGKFLLCADYRPVNLTHVSRKFGLGVPLIATLHSHNAGNGEIFAKDMVLPGTLIMDFPEYPPADKKNGRFRCKLIFTDSRNIGEVTAGGRKIPVEQDLSTPLAYMAKDPLPFNFLFYMMRPEDTREMQGLYRFESFDPERIPVVLVHGLMSDTRTWMQMINTLRSDPVFLKHYQVYGFSYSSGNPIINSATFMRQALKAERDRIIKAGYPTEKFDQMVLVGHSMGGLLSRLAISSSGKAIEQMISGQNGESIDSILAELNEDEKKFAREAIYFDPLPFVKRVVFIAVPHRGSVLAQSWIGKFGAWCIRLPEKLTNFRRSLALRNFIKTVGKEQFNNTGIDNLDPDNIAIQYLNILKMSDRIPFHSIIGNKDEAGSPGGSDGIVPYSSSHLDDAKSELIVKSGHSAQKNPLAIQELRRILLLHIESLKKSE